MNLKQNLVSAFNSYQLGEEKQSAVVAVSGGMDSVVLLHSLYELRKQLKLELSVAHLNHKLRGEAACKDAEFVRGLAEKLGLKFVIENRKVKELARDKGFSIEQAARRARYDFLDQVQKEQGAELIILGHHRDDQVETVLMHLLRGTGIHGLAGMKQYNPPYFRPLLNCSRSVIKKWANSKGLNWRIDQSNRNTKFLRNRVRHNLLPVLEDQFNPRVREAVYRTSRIMSEVEKYVKQQVTRQWNTITHHEDNQVIIELTPYLDLSRMLQQELARKAVRTITGATNNVTYDQIQQIITEANKQSPRSHLDLPGDCSLDKKRDQLIFHPPSDCSSSSNRSAVHVLPIGCKTCVERLGWCFTLRQKPRHQIDRCTIQESPPDKEFLDWSKLSGSVKVRTRAEGDSFRPLGMEGEKKLKDFFIDEKVPYAKRDQIPIIFDRKHIIWVVGYRIDDRYKVAKHTEQILQLKAEKL